MTLKLGTILLAVVTVATFVGCGSASKPGADAAGTVTLDGAPLPYGTITLEPLNAGKASAATPIEQGKFTFPEGNSLSAGKYKVVIRSSPPPVVETDPDKAMEMASKPAPPDPILPKYNTATELTTDIKADGMNTLEFAVTSK